MTVSLPLLRRIGSILRDAEWNVTAVFESRNQRSAITQSRCSICAPPNPPLFGLAIDIGTTTVSCWLVDLISGKVVAQAAEYNGQIARGEDVISRIIYASKNGSSAEMQALVIETINSLIAAACEKAKVDPQDIFKATIAGNSTMMHLLLDIPAASIRLAPFVTAINHVPPLKAIDLGLKINPEAAIDCLPGVASYVGADITAGVLSSGMEDGEQLTLFMDVGTNGEIVLGNRDWLVTCACSAGPAFEGAGVVNGMRATRGAIEEVWINGETLRADLSRHRQREAARHLRQRADRAVERDVPDGRARQGRQSQFQFDARRGRRSAFCDAAVGRVGRASARQDAPRPAGRAWPGIRRGVGE